MSLRRIIYFFFKNRAFFITSPIWYHLYIFFNSTNLVPLIYFFNSTKLVSCVFFSNGTKMVTFKNFYNVYLIGAPIKKAVFFRENILLCSKSALLHIFKVQTLSLFIEILAKMHLRCIVGDAFLIFIRFCL